MSKKEIFIVTRTLDTEYGLDVDVEPFSDREEAEKCAKYWFESERDDCVGFGHSVKVDDESSDSYEFYNEDNEDRCEINVLTKEIDL